MKKYLVTVSTRAFTATIVEREGEPGEGPGWDNHGWPVLSEDEIKQLSKDFRDDHDLQSRPEELKHFMEIEEFEEAGPEYD